MEKALRNFSVYALGMSLALFIGYAGVAAATQSSPWYLAALWTGFVLTGVLSLISMLAYLAILCNNHLNSLVILDDWRCTYWPSEKNLRVIIWFRDYSGSDTFSAQCVARFDQQVVELNDDLTLGGTYLSKSTLKSGRDQPIIAEFSKRNIELHDVSAAEIIVSIRPSSGVWARKRKRKKVAVHVINH